MQATLSQAIKAVRDNNHKFSNNYADVRTIFIRSEETSEFDDYISDSCEIMNIPCGVILDDKTFFGLQLFLGSKHQFLKDKTSRALRNYFWSLYRTGHILYSGTNESILDILKNVIRQGNKHTKKNKNKNSISYIIKVKIASGLCILVGLIIWGVRK